MSAKDKTNDNSKKTHEEKSPLAVEFGKRLKEVRKTLDIMQKDMAEEIGVASSNVSMIEKGINKPGFEFMYKLSQRYNINPFYLFHGKGSMFLEDKTEDESASKAYDFGVFAEMVDGLLKTMEKSTIARLGVLEFFHKYRIQHKSLIDEEIKDYEDQKRIRGEKESR